MTTSAPRARLVDALSGAKAPTKFFQALSEADEHVALAAECERLRDENATLRARLISLSYVEDGDEITLRCRVDELRAESDRLRRDNAKLQEVADGLACAVNQLSDERDEALVRADELWAQVCDQSVELNQLRAQLDRARAEKDTANLRAGSGL